MSSRFHKKAFTLIEMLIVIVIIGILAVALVPRIMSAQYRANDAARNVKVGQVATAIDLYKEDKGSYPLAPFDEYIPYLTITPSEQEITFSPKKSLFPSAFAATLPPSTVKSLSGKLEGLLSSMPTDPGKGTATYSDGNCIKGGDSFAYYTDVSGKMYAITSLSESTRGNSSNCKGVVDSNNTANFNTRGAGLTVSTINTKYPDQSLWTNESCFSFNNGSIRYYYYSKAGCPKDVIIPKVFNGGVYPTKIEDQAFYGKGITSIRIPDTVTYIGVSSFSSNPLAGTLILPDSVKTIADGAFWDARFTNIILPKSLTYVGKQVFNGSLLSDDQAFIYARNSDGSEDKTKIVSYGGTNKSPYIPYGVKTIGIQAFDRTKINSVTLPDSLTTIEQHAFYANQLTQIKIPNSVTNIADYAFMSNPITSIEFSTSNPRIGKYQFASNTLTTITIPEFITTIDENAFARNYNLSSIIIKNSSLCQSLKGGSVNIGVTVDKISCQ